jgi:hypothetical protein
MLLHPGIYRWIPLNGAGEQKESTHGSN